MKKTQGGQALLEVLIAMVMVIIVATAFISLGATTVRNSSFSQNQAQATKLAQEGIEAMISIRDLNSDGAVQAYGGDTKWTDLAAETLGNCSGSTDPTDNCATDFSLGNFAVNEYAINAAIPIETIGIFSRKIRITDPNPSQANVKDVTVFVWWTDAQGLHKSVLTRKLSNGGFKEQ